MFENVDVNSAGDMPCREKKKNKATTPFLHVHGAKHVPLWAVPKMLRVFVRILAIPSPEVVSRRKVNTTLLLYLVKRLDKMHGGILLQLHACLTSGLDEGIPDISPPGTSPRYRPSRRLAEPEKRHGR